MINFSMGLIQYIILLLLLLLLLQTMCDMKDPYG